MQRVPFAKRVGWGAAGTVLRCCLERRAEGVLKASKKMSEKCGKLVLEVDGV